MFTAIENALYPVVYDLNAYLSNYVLVFLLIAVGLWYSIRTRFVQVRCFGEGMRRVFGNLTLRGAGRHRQHRRRVRRDFDRRPRRDFLDVGHRLFRHGDHLCRGDARADHPAGR